MLLPPPLLFVAAFAAGSLLDRLGPRIAPWRLLDVAGAALVAAGLVFAAPALVGFARKRTTIVPHGIASSLLTGGCYRVTRNPMYVGLTAIYVGAALLMHVLSPLVTLIVPLWILDRRTIPFEEQNLLAIFGDDYRRYTARVRRWL